MSDFQANVIYDVGKSFSRRFGGRKYTFRQHTPEPITDREFAQVLDRTPGFAVQVTAGELYPEEDAPKKRGRPAKKKLVPKKKRKKK
jgi:hypothetical protein